jgi:hypothetical protein
MPKKVLLLICTISGIGVYLKAMNHDLSLVNARNVQTLSDARICIQAIKEQLRFTSKHNNDLSSFQKYFTVPFMYIADKPDKFLQYCYYQQYHNEKMGDCLVQIATFKTLLEQCKKVQINGCSAIGITILAPNVTLNNKFKFIEKLIKHEFQLTDNDKKIIYTIIYDELYNTIQASIIEKTCFV